MCSPLLVKLTDDFSVSQTHYSSTLLKGEAFKEFGQVDRIVLQSAIMQCYIIAPLRN
ncbi:MULTISPECIES: hypothetical protein [unclassified Bartonella]|uniref:hypothetical protein n=1 Tax=unclassified Bartonella TaxID=2645622 RepID=UPI0035CF3F59